MCVPYRCFETLRLGASSTPLAAALHLGSDEADAAALAALRRHLVDGGAGGEDASALDTGVCSALAAACEVQITRECLRVQPGVFEIAQDDRRPFLIILRERLQAELRRMPTSEEEDARELASLSLSADDAGRRHVLTSGRCPRHAHDTPTT